MSLSRTDISSCFRFEPRAKCGDFSPASTPLSPGTRTACEFGDSSAWLEYFADGSNATFFAPAIENQRELIVPTIVLFEVYKPVRQQRDDRDALAGSAILHHGRIVELTARLALSAAQISYSEKLPLADSIILATARAEHAIIWTQDADFEALEHVKYRAKKA